MLTQGNFDGKSFQGKRHSHYQLKQCNENNSKV